jgi:hypothetical protein
VAFHETRLKMEPPPPRAKNKIGWRRYANLLVAVPKIYRTIHIKSREIIYRPDQGDIVGREYIISSDFMCMVRYILGTATNKVEQFLYF